MCSLQAAIAKKSLHVSRKCSRAMVNTVGAGRFVPSLVKRFRCTEVSNTIIGVTTNQRTIHGCIEMFIEFPAKFNAVLCERLTRETDTPDRLCPRIRQVRFLSDSRYLNFRRLRTSSVVKRQNDRFHGNTDFRYMELF